MPKVGPVWSGSICHLPTQKKVGSRISLGNKRLDLGNFTLAPKTLLMEAINELNFPASASIIHKFARAIREIETSDIARDILNSPLQDLVSLDITRLFSIIEDAIEKTWAVKSRYSGSLLATACYKRISTPLGDGNHIKDSGFSSRFSPTNKIIKNSAARRPLTQSENKNKYIDYPNPADIIASINFNSFAERNEQAFLESAKRQGEIARLCQLSFKHHDEIVEKIIKIKSQKKLSLPTGRGGFNKYGLLSRNNFLSLNKENQLNFLLHLSEYHKWHEITPTNKEAYPLDSAELLLPKKHIDSQGSRKEILLSDYFLTASAVGACVVAIQNSTGLNSEVIESLSPNDIERSKYGYRLVGIKGKTDQIIEKEIFEKSTLKNEDIALTHKVAICGLELLLKNASNIEKYTHSKASSILLTINKKAPRNKVRIFSNIGVYKLIRAFCSYHEIINFDTRYLRELKLQTHSLSPEENIYTSQQLAGHTSPRTTETYTFTKVLSHLQMANIRRYMDMLAGSILWRTNRLGILEESGLTQRNIKLNLLFPIENLVTANRSIIDKWIDSGFKTKIHIGKDELTQCAIQFEYYKKNIDNIQQLNSKKFLEHHIPRIIACLAIHNVILMSQFASVYRSIRSDINAAK